MSQALSAPETRNAVPFPRKTCAWQFEIEAQHLPGISAVDITAASAGRTEA